MRRTGPRVLGSLLLLGILAGCRGRGDDVATSADAPALVAYTAPQGAPEYCTLLARAVSFRQLPAVLGRLSVDSRDLAAAQQMMQTRTDLAGVLAAVRADGDGTLIRPLEDLVDALGAVADTGVTEQSADRIGTDLAAVGRAVQPACRYPT